MEFDHSWVEVVASYRTIHFLAYAEENRRENFISDVTVFCGDHQLSHSLTRPLAHSVGQEGQGSTARTML